MPDRFLKVLIPDDEVNGNLIFKVIKDDGSEYDPYYIKLDQIADFAGGGGGGVVYDSYVALLSQSGTNAPVATVLQNDLGGTVVWTRDTAGDYVGTLAGAFTLNKTHIPPFGDSTGNNTVWIPLWNGNGGPIAGYYTIYRATENTIRMSVVTTDGDFVDLSTLVDTTALSLPEIRVYP